MFSILSVFIATAVIGFSPWLALAILAAVWITFVMFGIITRNLVAATFVPWPVGFIGIFGAWAMVADWGPGLMAITLVLVVMYVSERRISKIMLDLREHFDEEWLSRQRITD